MLLHKGRAVTRDDGPTQVDFRCRYDGRELSSSALSTHVASFGSPTSVGSAAKAADTEDAAVTLAVRETAAVMSSRRVQGTAVADSGVT